MMVAHVNHKTEGEDAPVVYFTSDVSPEGLKKVYDALGRTLNGSVAVKLSTGEQGNENYLKPELIGELVQNLNGTIVECNTAYGGARAATAMHLQVAEDHGFTKIADVDIMDADGSMEIPVEGGTYFTEDLVGSHLANYDSMLALSHFKGHPVGGFGGALKNISIGVASQSGKSWIHSAGTEKEGQRIHQLFASMQNHRLGVFGVIPASLLGIASPLCMYGTIPIAASFSTQGMADDWLAAFMMSSILLTPQLLVYTSALGHTALWIRFLSCFLCGCCAGLLVRTFYKGRHFFNFEGFGPEGNRDTDPNLLLRLLKNIGRNVKRTGPYFLAGILLAALFQIHVPSDAFADLFSADRRFGVFMAATIGVPLYACGGGTIPLLRQWLMSGMSMGAAAAFMITGPATKITNLGALKTFLGIRRFLLYIGFTMLFAFICGMVI